METILILLLIREYKENRAEYKTNNRVNRINRHRYKSKVKMDKVIQMLNR